MTTWENEFTTPGTSARIWLVLQVDVVSQNIDTNQTTLNWYVRGEERITNASPYNLNAGRSGSASVNGTVWSTGSSTYDFRATFATNYWASGTTVVTHDADGSKTISVSADYNSNDSILGTASLSSTLALPTIPRATTPTVSPTSGDTGSTYTITHSPASTSFYHDVAYGFDGEGGSFTDIVTNLVGTDTSTGWTPAHTLLPNDTSKTATIRLITRSSSGGSIIGTKYVTLPLTVPASVKPTISSVAWADSQVSAPNMPTLMGGAGRYVQRWSKLTPTVTAAGAGGSTVTSIQVTQNGQTTPSGTPFTNAIALSGSVPFSVVATDSRGRTNDAYSSTVAVTAYNFPNLPTPTVTRTSDAGGTTPSPTGTYLRITPNASVSSLNFSGEKNLLEYQVRTRLSGGSWTTVQAWTATGVVGTTWTANKILSGYLANAEYEVEVSIRDLFGKNAYDTGNTIKVATVTVPSESVDMDWNQGLGFGFNKYHSGSGAFVQVAGGLDVVGNIEGDTITQAGLSVIDTGDAATTTVKGIAELSTDAEAAAGTDTSRVVTPSNLGSGLSKVLPSRLQTTAYDISNLDLNNYLNTGWYRGYDCTNAPLDNQWFYYEIIRHSDDYVIQTAHYYWDNRSFVRQKITGAWSTWREIAYSGNGSWVALPTLASGWVNGTEDGGDGLGAIVQSGYRRDYIPGVGGLLTLNMYCTKSGGWNATTNLFTLPVGYRSSRIHWFQWSWSNVRGELKVFPSGVVQIVANGTHNGVVASMTFPIGY